jgi:hypothetical protein
MRGTGFGGGGVQAQQLTGDRAIGLMGGGGVATKCCMIDEAGCFVAIPAEKEGKSRFALATVRSRDVDGNDRAILYGTGNRTRCTGRDQG